MNGIGPVEGSHQTLRDAAEGLPSPLVGHHGELIDHAGEAKPGSSVILLE
jgi:hypothetical protein